MDEESSWVIVDDDHNNYIPPGRTRKNMQQSRASHFLARISEYVESITQELRSISLSIHDNPELKFKEKHAHELLTSYVRGHAGWNVVPSAYGLETAFVATFEGNTTGHTVSFNAEYDALPSIGHACGHNLIAIVSLAAALATAEIIRQANLPGRVVLFGTPAEEGGGGKIKLLNAGAYKDHAVDISLISHPSNGPNAALVRTTAFAQYTVEYFGKEAHAAARPWEGINALDALIAAINNVSLMRQQTQPGDMIQYRISNGGLKPNIIHAYAAGVFVLRAPSSTRLERLRTRFYACLEAGATATNAELKVKEGLGYKNHIPNHVLGKSYGAHFQTLGGQLSDPALEDLAPGSSVSTDQGDVSHVMPSISADFWIRSEDQDGKPLGGPHTPDFAQAARTAEAHKLAMRVSKALACTAVDVLTQEGLLEAAKQELDTMTSL